MEYRRTQQPQLNLLCDILPAPGTLIARCTSKRCSAVTALEFSAHLYRYVRSASLRRLEEGLRCTCGARQGVLEPWPTNLALLPGKDRLYLFVA